MIFFFLEIIKEENFVLCWEKDTHTSEYNFSQISLACFKVYVRLISEMEFIVHSAYFKLFDVLT